MPTLERTSDFSVDADTLYRWHARPGAFERLVPPWDDIEVVDHTGGIEDGARRLMEIRQGPITLEWEALHRDHVAGHRFVDEQVRGPFARWVHEHRFDPLGDGRSRLVDDVDYRLPLGPLGNLVAGTSVRTMLDRMFTFRHRRTAEDLKRHRVLDERLRIAVTGSSGLIGSALCPFLTTGGHEVVRMVRDQNQLDDDAIYWSPADGEIDARGLEGVDVVVHLAGESVVQPWTDEARRRIRESRVDGTRLLAETLAGLDDPPRAFLSASAVGYYGETGDERHDEDSGPGDGFLSEVARRWERATAPAEAAGIRTVQLRIGIVMTPRGGTLARLLPAVRYGMADRIGSGTQFVSWIDIDDVLGAIHFLAIRDDLEGPFNLTAPEPVRNHRLLDVLGDVVGRPNLVPVPETAAEFSLSPGVARETVLVSQRVVPSRLQQAGFEFFYGDLFDSLAMKLGAPR